MIAYTTYVNDGRVKRHAQALAERGDHVDLLCLANPQQGEHNGVNVIGLKIRRYRGAKPTSYLRSYLRFFTAASATAARLAFHKPYDVVIVCTMPDAAVLCALPLKFLGSKVVLDMHDTMPELYREKFRGWRAAWGARLLQFEELASTWLANRVLAVSEPHRQRLEEAGVKSDKIEVILNVPDHRIFGLSLNGRTSPREFIVVCHGTIAERLGLDVAIRAMAILRERRPEVKLMVVGGGDYLSACKNLAAGLDLKDSVRFFDPVPLEQLPELLRTASLGLIPNRASSATHLMLPVKLLEYAAIAIPVVAARLRTIEHYFSSSAVRYFQPGDPADLAATIEDLYLHPAEREALAKNARQTLNSINWPSQQARYYAAIDSLLADRVRSGVQPRGLDNNDAQL
jgi:glycosyltransferase involved in cell wall biosynthesis